MRFLKIISIFFFTIFILLVVWIKLPNSLKYYNAIELGNKFAKNIETYNKQNKQLPEEMDWETLKRLNKSEVYETWWPTYQKSDEQNFTLTFIEGFDGPYLTYDSKTKKWEKK
jgi:hypothetical protein